MDLKNAESKTIFSWPETPSMNQNFSFPDTIIYYLLMNPSSPKCYNKMIKSCKYFFEKNPILIVGHMDGLEHDIIICEKMDCRSSVILHPCCVESDISKIKAKIWLTKKFSLWSNENILNFIPMLRSKLFRCNITNLSMSGQIVLYDDFKILASCVTCINLHNVKMVYADESPVMLETILEALSNLKLIQFLFKKNFSNVSASTFQNINKQENLGRLKLFHLFNIPEMLNVKDLSTFIMNCKNSRFLLDFDENISEDYKHQLDGLIYAIIDSNISNRLINYDGQNAEKLKILFDRLNEDDDLDV